MNGIRFFKLRMALTRFVSWLTERCCALLWLGSDDYKPKAYIVGSAEGQRLVQNTIQLYAAHVQLQQKTGGTFKLEVLPDLVASSETAGLEEKQAGAGVVMPDEWNAQMDKDAASGKLDFLSSEAVKAVRPLTHQDLTRTGVYDALRSVGAEPSQKATPDCNS